MKLLKEILDQVYFSKLFYAVVALNFFSFFSMLLQKNSFSFLCNNQWGRSPPVFARITCALNVSKMKAQELNTFSIPLTTFFQE